MPEVLAAVLAGDLKKTSEIFRSHPELRQDKKLVYNCMKFAARKNHVSILAFLIEIGVDVNCCGDSKPEGVIDDAASAGAIEAVQFLLKKGARINYAVDGQTRCLPLFGAIIADRIDIVKLLVQNGADFNAVWIDQNALSTALMHDKDEIAIYLKSVGASLPGKQKLMIDKVIKSESAEDEVVGHIKSHIGTPKELILKKIVPTTPNINIFSCRLKNSIALVTVGMSSSPIPQQSPVDPRHAELIMYLPKDWPLNASDAPEKIWPIQWMRKIALYPHQLNQSLGGKVAIFANNEPPMPLSKETKLSCILAITKSGKFDRFERADGEVVHFYSLYPLYTEERDLERKDGVEALLRAFDKHSISPIVNLRRKNVAL